MKLHDIEFKIKPKNANSKTIKILLMVLGVLVAGACVSIALLVGVIKNDDASSLFVVKDHYKEPEESAAPTMVAVLDDDTPTATPEPDGTIHYNGSTYIKNENVVNLLFLGVDTDTQRRIDMMGYRSDVIMVCAVDVETKKATLISIPRDTKTTVYKINENTGEVTETVQWKINTAYSYGGGIKKYSFPNAMACVQKFLERDIELEQPLDFKLDIPVYLYASMDMDGIPHVAKSVGGVPITLENSIPDVGRKGQTVTLKYDNARAYLTNRHISGTNGDLGRAYRQQKFMMSLAKEIKSMDAPSIITNLYDDLQKYVYTNLDETQMLDLAKVLMKTDIDSIEMITIPGEGHKVDGTYFMFHDEQATLEILLNTYYTKVE